MKKSEPRMFLNISIENKEFEEKVKIAMDKYAEDVVLKNLDETIKKIVDKRLDALLTASSWHNDRKIQGMSLEAYVKSKSESVISEFIDKNAREILAKRLAEILVEKS